jgi:hypothetical protein
MLRGGEKLIDFLGFVSPIIWEKGISSESMKKCISMLFGPIGHVIFDVLMLG